MSWFWIWTLFVKDTENKKALLIFSVGRVHLFFCLFIYLKYLFFLKHGNEAASVADLKIADQLYHYMVGGQTKPQVGFILDTVWVVTVYISSALH